MAKIAAFRGIRYNAHKVGDLSLVISQPYDRVPVSYTHLTLPTIYSV